MTHMSQGRPAKPPLRHRSECPKCGTRLETMGCPQAQVTVGQDCPQCRKGHMRLVPWPPGSFHDELAPRRRAKAVRAAAAT